MLLSVADLVRYRDRPRVRRVVTTALPTSTVQAVGYAGLHDGAEHMALVAGEIDQSSAERVPVHVHRECLSGDVLRSTGCDCGQALDEAMARFASDGRGVVVYLRPAGDAQACGVFEAPGHSEEDLSAEAAAGWFSRRPRRPHLSAPVGPSLPDSTVGGGPAPPQRLEAVASPDDRHSARTREGDMRDAVICEPLRTQSEVSAGPCGTSGDGARVHGDQALMKRTGLPPDEVDDVVLRALLPDHGRSRDRPRRGAQRGSAGHRVWAADRPTLRVRPQAVAMPRCGCGPGRAGSCSPGRGSMSNAPSPERCGGVSAAARV